MSARTDGTEATTNYNKLRENFWGGSLKTTGSEKAEMANLRRRRLAKEKEATAQRKREAEAAEEAAQEMLRRRLAEEEVGK